MKNRRTRRRGFTLLEILLVLAILVILGGTVGVYFAKTQKSAYKKTAKVQIDSTSQVLEIYHMDIGSYPSTQQGLGALNAAPADMADTNKWDGPYTKVAIPPDPWGRPYQYELQGDVFRSQVRRFAGDARHRIAHQTCPPRVKRMVDPQMKAFALPPNRFPPFLGQFHGAQFFGQIRR